MTQGAAGQERFKPSIAHATRHRAYPKSLATASTLVGRGTKCGIGFGLGLALSLAADLLQIPKKTLYDKLGRHGLPASESFDRAGRSVKAAGPDRAGNRSTPSVGDR